MKMWFNPNPLFKDIDFANKKLMNCIALTVERKAKQLCPVRTGTLRRSITHEAIKDGTRVGTNVEYGIYVELGSKRWAGKPFLRPALESFSQTDLNNCIRKIK